VCHSIPLNDTKYCTVVDDLNGLLYHRRTIYMEQNGTTDGTKAASKVSESKEAFVLIDHVKYDIQSLFRCARRTDWSG